MTGVEVPRPVENVATWARKGPHKLALHHEGTGTTFSELDALVSDAAALFRSAGLSRGERCGIVLPNSLLYVVCFLGLQKLGCVPVLIPQAATNNEIASCIAKTQLAGLVLAARTQIGGTDGLRVLFEAPEGKLRQVTIDSASRSAERVLSGENHAAIFFGSGTSGAPKPAIISYEATTWGVLSNYAEGCERDVRIHASSLSASIGIAVILVHLHSGTPVYLLSPPFLPDRTLNAIEKYQGTLLSTVPFAFQGLLDRGAGTRYSVKTLRMATVGGALAQRQLKLDWNRKFPEAWLRPLYTCTETFHPVLLAGDRDSSLKTGCVGRPVPGVQARVDETGELLIRLPFAMPGYFESPELNAAKFTADGWYRTGDLFSVDSEGDYLFRGILGDMINFSGKKIFPAEVEAVLVSIPGVRAAKVFGVDHPELGQIAAAAVRLDLDSGINVSEARIREVCSERLSDFKVPSEIVFADETDLTPTMKIRKESILKKIMSGERK